MEESNTHGTIDINSNEERENEPHPSVNVNNFTACEKMDNKNFYITQEIIPKNFQESISEMDLSFDNVSLSINGESLSIDYSTEKKSNLELAENGIPIKRNLTLRGIDINQRVSTNINSEIDKKRYSIQLCFESKEKFSFRLYLFIQFK